MVRASALWLSFEILLPTTFSAGHEYAVTVDIDRAPVAAQWYNL